MLKLSENFYRILIQISNPSLLAPMVNVLSANLFFSVVVIFDSYDIPTTWTSVSMGVIALFSPFMDAVITF